MFHYSASAYIQLAMQSAVGYISNDRFRPSVHLSVSASVMSVTVWYHVKTTEATIMGSSQQDNPITLVSSRLTSPRNSKGNLGSGGAE